MGRHDARLGPSHADGSDCTQTAEKAKTQMPVAMGKMGIQFCLVDFKGEPFQEKEKGHRWKAKTAAPAKEGTLWQGASS